MGGRVDCSFYPMRTGMIMNEIRDINEGLNLKERRSYKRIPVNILTRYYYNELLYSCTIRNLSETGMLLSSKHGLPEHSMFVILVPSVNKPFLVNATVSHVKISTENYCELGVNIMSPSDNYIDFVKESKRT